MHLQKQHILRSGVWRRAMRNPFVPGVAALMCATAAFSFTPRHPGDHELRAEKYGRVIDANTGAGISDARVIVVWGQNSSGVSDMISAGSWCNLQRISVTDADGRYAIPDVSRELDAKELHFGLLSLNKLWSDWQLIVFKPGYVRAGDLEILPRHEKQLFLWEVEAPETHGAPFGKVEVKTVAMKKMDLDAPNVWIYYSAILSAGRCSDSHGRPLDEPGRGEIAKAMSALVRIMPCEMPRETVITPHALAAFGWVLDDSVFFDRIKALEHLKTGESKSTTAGTLCRALNNEEKQQ